MSDSFIRENLYRFLFDEITRDQFENWITGSEKLKEGIKLEDYLTLLSFVGSSQGDFKEAVREIWIRNYRADIDLYRIYQIAKGLSEGTFNMALGVRELARYREAKNYEIISINFVGLASEMDDIPLPSEYDLWEKESLRERLKKIDLYKDSIIEESKMLLSDIGRVFGEVDNFS